jgi:hypothetical protein
MKFKLFCIGLTLAVFLCSASLAAQEDKLSLLGESRFFSIYGPKDIDIESLLKKINFEYLIHLTSLSTKNPGDCLHILTKTLDALYLEVSDILSVLSTFIREALSISLLRI